MKDYVYYCPNTDTICWANYKVKYFESYRLGEDWEDAQYFHYFLIGEL